MNTACVRPGTSLPAAAGAGRVAGSAARTCALQRELITLFLLTLKKISRLFYRFEISWHGPLPPDPWADLKLVLLLNHTSLYEFLFAGWVPRRFLRQVARQGLLPVADKTLKRPVVGRFFKLLASNVQPVTRQKDGTWDWLMAKVRPDSLVVMCPEGRMKRANGLDNSGMAMTVRGGVADLLTAIGHGRMLVAYSGGLHHVQVPGQLVPRVFKTLRMRLESFEIAEYIDRIQHSRPGLTFKQAVIRDLEKRRNQLCP